MKRMCTVCFLVILLGSAGCGQHDSDETPPLTGLRVSQVLGETDLDFARAEAPRAFVFPDDHGPHPEYRSEWWYLTAVLDTADGDDMGLHFTLFRQALGNVSGASPWQVNQAYLAHLAVTDVKAGTHRTAQRFTRAHNQAAAVTSDPFDLRILDWHVTQVGSDPWQLRMEAADARRGLAVDLMLTQTRPVMLQGEQGLSHKGPGQASYYYSIPRIAVTGQVSLDEQVQSITGTAWLDREWSTSVLGSHLVGWDWFALQLDSGEDIMLFQLRRKDGTRDPYNHGARRPPGQPQRKLAADDYTLTPIRHWVDQDGVAWPVSWMIEGIAESPLEVTALLDDQLMELGLVYWEGLVEVKQSGQRVGRGYLEMTGYGGEIE